MNDELPTPLDFLKAVYCNEGLPLNTRLRAAMAAAPFCHPKLAVHAQVSREDLAEALERAMAASSKIIDTRPMQVIEHSPPAGEPSQVSEPPDHSKPFAQNSKHRFKRF